MRASLLAGALLLAAAAGSTAQGAPECSAPDHESGHRSAVVIRAGAPFALGDRTGDAAFRGACWKVAAGWVSEEKKGTTRVAIAIARTCS
jgi:hypothetical protein